MGIEKVELQKMTMYISLGYAIKIAAESYLYYTIIQSKNQTLFTDNVFKDMNLSKFSSLSHDTI